MASSAASSSSPSSSASSSAQAPPVAATAAPESAAPDPKRAKALAKAAAKAFQAEATQLQRRQEVTRIMKSFKLNPLQILSLPTTATIQDVKRQYRRLALVVHPDKVDEELREQAQDAFAKLQEAHKDLLDEAKRTALNEVIEEARLKQPKELAGEALERQTMAEVREILIDREWRRHQAVEMAAKLEKKAREDSEAAKKDRTRVAKARRKWKEDRESRVDTWRGFTDSLAKKKGKKRKKGMMQNALKNKLLETDEDRTYIKRVKR